MATTKIKLCIVNSRALKDGTVPIRFKILHGLTSAYISTGYSVEKSQWNGGQVIRHNRATEINSDLYKRLYEYQDYLKNTPIVGPDVTASDIKQWLENLYFPSELFSEFANQYIDRCKNNNQDSYAKNLKYSVDYMLDCFGQNLRLKDISCISLKSWETWLFKHGNSSTTVNIRMSHLKAILNAAVNEGIVEYKLFPFRGYKIPPKAIRDICISRGELEKLRTTEFASVSDKKYTLARDLFLLSFYLGGINLIDMMNSRLDGDILTFTRQKTARKKTGTDKEVSITIQPEAREILNKYLDPDTGKIITGYKYREYKQLRSYITKTLRQMGRSLGFEKDLMFYAARKTFVQYGSELGIPLYILEYAIGQTIKDANNRPIFNYLKIMRQQADLAIRVIIDYSLEEIKPEEEIPLPDWARRK